MGALLGQALSNVGQAAASGAIGQLTNRLGVNYDRRQSVKTAQALMGVQMQGEKEMMDYQNEKQLEQYNDTWQANYDKIKANKLSTALMYGGGGQGGQTGAGVPNVGGGAPDTNTRGAQASMGLMNVAQLGLMEAQKKNIEADTANKEADTKNKPIQGNVMQWQAKDLAEGINNKIAQHRLMDAQATAQDIMNEINGASKNDQITMWGEKLNEQINRAKSAMANANVDEATQNTRIEQFKENLIGSKLENILKGTKNQELIQVIKNMQQELKNGISNMMLKWTELERQALGMNKDQNGQLDRDNSETLKNLEALGKLGQALIK